MLTTLHLDEGHEKLAKEDIFGEVRVDPNFALQTNSHSGKEASWLK
jgi:hypothetical protein